MVWAEAFQEFLEECKVGLPPQTCGQIFRRVSAEPGTPGAGGAAGNLWDYAHSGLCTLELLGKRLQDVLLSGGIWLDALQVTLQTLQRDVPAFQLEEVFRKSGVPFEEGKPGSMLEAISIFWFNGRPS